MSEPRKLSADSPPKDLLAALEQAHSEVERLQRDLSTAELRLTRAHEQFVELRRSVSWRITAPLRLLSRRSRRAVHDFKDSR